MNTMTAEESADLADRIRAREFNWRHAFDAWYLVNGGVPDLIVDSDGTRRVERDATQFIKTHPGYLASHADIGYGGIVQEDGTLQLDTAGEYRYRPLGQVDWGFTAYERIRT